MAVVVALMAAPDLSTQDGEWAQHQTCKCMPVAMLKCELCCGVAGPDVLRNNADMSGHGKSASGVRACRSI